uniref:Uncharacterized protein n=1 Tax=Arundo donax TaxID=35708 RepID=A0A0A9FQ03_ARUDO
MLILPFIFCERSCVFEVKFLTFFDQPSSVFV